ncbi:ATP-binding protein [Actinomadura chokoriensis]|uniref:ATP-binding protein n=1 Tax=Actinomadura chokoriensis TaxID=454156 RepID=A0ABV4R9K8_9ACTN
MSVSVAAKPGTRPPERVGRGRVEVLGLAALPSAVPVARYFARALLGSWEVEEERGWACQQVVTELVGNALEATGGEPGGTDIEVRGIAMMLLRFRLCAANLVVEVRDDSSALPRIAYAAPLDEGGRGLMMAGSLASGWGMYTLGVGKVVWAAWDVADGS